MPRPSAADEDTGGVEWTEPLTVDIVGRVPTTAPPERKGEVVGIMNSSVLTWFPEIDPNDRIPGYELDALATMANITKGSVERWFGIPRTDGQPRAPRNCAPLAVIGRQARGFLPAERRRRMCTIKQSEYLPTDPKYAKDVKKRAYDFARCLFAACVCATNPAPALATGTRYTHTATEAGAGGIYRAEPTVGKRNARNKWAVYEGEKWPCATAASAVAQVIKLTDPDSGLAIDMGADTASCWVRIWVESTGNRKLPWVVRYRHVYPTQNEVYGVESFDVRKDDTGGGFETAGAPG